MSTEEIADDLLRRHPDSRTVRAGVRMGDRLGIGRRPWNGSRTAIAAMRGVGERSAAAFDGAFALAVPAALEALAEAGLTPGDVDFLVTSHTSSYTVPGLDVHLIHELEMRPDVAKLGMATMACVGGVQALVHAVRYVRHHPGAVALAVVAESLSTLYHPELTGREDVLYGSLFGDAGGAVVVTSPPGPGPGLLGGGEGRPLLELSDGWELVLPGSLQSYWGEISPAGIRFVSGKLAPKAAGLTMPYLTRWLAGRPVDWAAPHPGGPDIITAALDALGLGEEAGRHSFDSLSEGNLGGVAVFNVLARTMRTGVPAGWGCISAFGPGFTAGALLARLWQLAA